MKSTKIRKASAAAFASQILLNLFNGYSYLFFSYCLTTRNGGFQLALLHPLGPDTEGEQDLMDLLYGVRGWEMEHSL